ncbi:NmrA family NAD(P)-binding protein [Streptomyces sp. AK02-04a]|nr:NmrA family NAD(P)-binding protein [Streptomyces sp. AK02-04a]MDX3762018.1 NmrA family NAD(P)-binding protein [Streptomyces sp. AK02-04a]
MGAHGVEVVAGDLGDASSLRAAFAEVDAAFAVTTPFEEGPQAEVEQGRAIVAAAAQAELPHLVLASVASANRSTGVPHFESKERIEEILAQEDLAWTVIAPPYFFDNLLGGLQSIREGWLQLPLPPDRPLQQLARQDLGALVTAVVADRERHVGRRIEAVSDAPTPAQMAAALQKVLHRPVEPVQVPLAMVHESSADMGAMWDLINREATTWTSAHCTAPIRTSPGRPSPPGRRATRQSAPMDLSCEQSASMPVPATGPRTDGDGTRVRLA